MSLCVLCNLCKIQHGTKKYVIGSIYRHPNQHSITNFCQHLDSILGKVSKSKTPCIIAGDLNIDFSRYNSHQETTDFVDNLLINNFVPMIIMPTRITTRSATITDHILYFEEITVIRTTS